jgi:hypothetical protein
MESKQLTGREILSSIFKMIIAFSMVFLTYNVFSDFHVIKLTTNYFIPTDLIHWGYMVMFVGTWFLMIKGVYKNLKKIGTFVLILISGLFIGGMIQRDIVADGNYDLIISLIQVSIATIIFTGLSWPEIRKKLFGVRIVDEEDTDSIDEIDEEN